MERTVTNVVTTENSTATFNGWDLNFEVKSDANSVKTIAVSGTKEDNYFTLNYDNGSISNYFQKGMDIPLFMEVLNEVNAIVDGFATVEEESE